MADVKPKEIAGCVGAAMQLCISTPIWLVLMFGVLSKVEAPGWMWALYWVYVPAVLACAIVASAIKLLEE